MKKRLSLTLCGVMLVALILPIFAFAAVIFEYGQLRAENTESWQYIYDGYLQTNLQVLYQGNRADRGYIRYSGGASGDTERLYTPYSRAETVSVSKQYNDTLNPFAPKVKFNYGFEWTPGSPGDIF